MSTVFKLNQICSLEEPRIFQQDKECECNCKKGKSFSDLLHKEDETLLEKVKHFFIPKKTIFEKVKDFVLPTKKSFICF